ncbi:MAG TPA: O-antigen ligase family protein [Xanthobacteraceae bacterium]|nr:O-antigen ligase family protein [Xanthobacteraceae bacterium]
MTTIDRAAVLGPQTLARLADWLAVGVAVSLPWSTSAAGIFVVLWLVAALPTLNVAAVRRELLTPAGGLPVLLWALAVVGMLWADVTWKERLAGLDSFHRLLFVPVLLAHFRRSANGIWVLYGFFASVVGVLLASWVLALTPGLSWRGKQFGIPVKDYVLQSEDFLLCAIVALERGFAAHRARQRRSMPVFFALALLFLANVTFIALGRTTLLVAPVLFLMLGWRLYGLKGAVGAIVLGCVVGASVWFESPYLRDRMDRSVAEFEAYRTSDALNSTGMHLEFLRKSLTFIAVAPVIGHGTGSIPEQFRGTVSADAGSASVASVNPHNQIFAVAIQLGLAGALILVAMWIAHLMLFRGGSFIDWIGLIVVVQNVVSSLVNSHLFDFTQGWIYIFGVGVAGGMVLRQRDLAQAAVLAAKP